MVNQFQGEINVNPPNYHIIRFDGRIIRVDYNTATQWNGFMRWVGETQLFEAIKIGVERYRKMTADYYVVRAHGAMELNISTTRVINVPSDLPTEVLALFFANSPWAKIENKIQNLLV